MKVMEIIGDLGEDEVIEVIDMGHGNSSMVPGRHYVSGNPRDELKKVTTRNNRLLLYVEQGKKERCPLEWQQKNIVQGPPSKIRKGKASENHYTAAGVLQDAGEKRRQKEWEE